jgi:hypothetical protein
MSPVPMMAMVSLGCPVTDSVERSDWLQPNKVNAENQKLMRIGFIVIPLSIASFCRKDRPLRR